MQHQRPPRQHLTLQSRPRNQQHQPPSRPNQPLNPIRTTSIMAAVNIAINTPIIITGIITIATTTPAAINTTHMALMTRFIMTMRNIRPLIMHRTKVSNKILFLTR